MRVTCLFKIMWHSTISQKCTNKRGDAGGRFRAEHHQGKGREPRRSTAEAKAGSPGGALPWQAQRFCVEHQGEAEEEHQGKAREPRKAMWQGQRFCGEHQGKGKETKRSTEAKPKNQEPRTAKARKGPRSRSTAKAEEPDQGALPRPKNGTKEWDQGGAPPSTGAKDWSDLRSGAKE